MNHLFKFCPLLFVFALFQSCDQEKEEIPSYIHVNKFTLVTGTSQGMNTSEIISAKVFVNGSEIGNFELPVNVPVKAAGKCIVNIFPNIKENGSINSQLYFKPYEYFIDTIELTRGKIDTVKPLIHYKTGTTFAWLEDFEDQGLHMSKSGTNTTDDSLLVIPTSTPGVDQPFAGPASKYCGYIHSTWDSLVVFEMSQQTTFSLPGIGADVYVEMDIKTNIGFQVGVYTDDGVNLVQSPVVLVLPTSGKWKKFYVNLKPETGNLDPGTQVRVFFGFIKDEGVTDDVDVYLDNIKLVYVP